MFELIISKRYGYNLSYCMYERSQKRIWISGLEWRKIEECKDNGEVGFSFVKLWLKFVVLVYRESLGSLDIENLQNVDGLQSFFMLVSW